MNASARPSRPVGNTKTLSLSQSPTITPIRASSGPNNRAMAAVPGGKAVDWSGILLRRDAGRDSTLVDYETCLPGLVLHGQNSAPSDVQAVHQSYLRAASEPPFSVFLSFFFVRKNSYVLLVM